MINKGVRICPNCKTVYRDKNVTICKKCGHATIERIITKEVRSDSTLGK